MQSVLLLQQLGDFFVVLVEPVLVFALGGLKGLIGCCIHGVAERGPAVFHAICDCSSIVSVNSALIEGLFSFETLSRFGAGFPWGRRLEEF